MMEQRIVRRVPSLAVICKVGFADPTNAAKFVGLTAKIKLIASGDRALRAFREA